MAKILDATAEFASQVEKSSPVRTERAARPRQTLTSEEAAKNLVIPQVQLEEAKLNEVKDWWLSELEKAKSDRGDLDDKLVEWERLYEARPKVPYKTFPWPGASNLVVPVIATAVDAVLSRILNAVFGGKYLWNVTPKAANWVELANPMNKWLDWASKDVIGLYRVCQRWFLSTIKFGTGVVKLPWRKRVRKVRYVEGNTPTEEYVVMHDGPEAEVISLYDFYWSPDATHAGLKNCTWVAQRSVLTWKEIKEREVSGVYYDVDRIKESKRAQATEMEEQQEESQGVSPSERDDYEIWEVYISYDVEPDGYPEELVLTIEPESRTAIRGVYNPYRHQERPFHIIRYMPRDHSILGIGLCQMLQDVQEEVTGIHNRRLDNATIANTRAWKRKSTARLGSDTVYPGAFIDVSEMDDIEELKLGDVYPSLLREEMHSNAIGEKRSGVSDYSVGRESSAIGSRATATSTMALIREGNKRFQMTIRDIRESLRDMGHQIIMLYQQFAPNNQVIYELFSPKDQQIVQQLFQLPADYTRNAVLLDTPAISEDNNKEIQQQTLMTLMGATQRFYEGMFQAFQLALNPAAPPPMQQLGIHAATTGAGLWEKTLEAFDLTDSDKFVPNVEQMLGAGMLLEGLNGGPGSVGGGQAAPGEPPPVPALAASGALLGGTGGRLPEQGVGGLPEGGLPGSPTMGSGVQGI